MGVLGKLASTTKQGFSSPVGWLLDTYQRRSGKFPRYSCANDKMDETKGEIEDFRRLFLACQSPRAPSAWTLIWTQVPLP